MTPDLTRRDALIALGVAGTATAGAATLRWVDPPTNERVEPTDRETLVAAAEALYPSQVTGVEEFVETFVLGRIQDRPDHREGVLEAARALDAYTRQWHDEPFAALDRQNRQGIFSEYALDSTDPDPDGTTRERVRYYLVNELLFAFYSSPTGGELVGIENPQGYPGGTDSYRRGP